MDFTYIVAAIISFVVGIVGGGIFVLARGQSFRRLLAVTIPVAVLIDFALLLNWSRVDEMTTALFMTDLAFFMLYALVGCSLGALPFLAGRRLYRMFRKSGAD